MFLLFNTLPVLDRGEYLRKTITHADGAFRFIVIIDPAFYAILVHIYIVWESKPFLKKKFY